MSLCILWHLTFTSRANIFLCSFRVAAVAPGNIRSLNVTFMTFLNKACSRCVVSACQSTCSHGIPATDLPARTPSALLTSPSVTMYLTATFCEPNCFPMSLPMSNSDRFSSAVNVAVQLSCPGQVTSNPLLQSEAPKVHNLFCMCRATISWHSVPLLKATSPHIFGCSELPTFSLFFSMLISVSESKTFTI